jgi:hypothetical protein
MLKGCYDSYISFQGWQLVHQAEENTTAGVGNNAHFVAFGGAGAWLRKVMADLTLY